jgi:orotate phosphoribosyltransferase-like protein
METKKKQPRHEELMEKVDDLYFKKGMSIKNILHELNTSNQTVTLCIETIIRKRSKERKAIINAPDISDEQVLKQNAVIERMIIDRDKYKYNF